MLVSCEVGPLSLDGLISAAMFVAPSWVVIFVWCE